ncbi:MAG: SIS domain-containing protein, partial [Erysipelotrichaceae bacterium]|nr:SIS domain-containing protein [Erysipelotrichaceae bacterium]
MWKYIKEEPACLSALISQTGIKEVAEHLKEQDRMLIVAHGSSYNAASSVAPLFEKAAGCSVVCTTPSRLKHNMDPQQMKNAFCIAISQTGNSRGVLEAVEQIKETGMPTIAVTEREGLMLDQVCDQSLYLQCGPEDSNAKTKGYSSTLVLLMLLCMELAVVKGKMSKEQHERNLSSLQEEIRQLDPVVQQTIRYCQDNDFGKGMEEIYFLGDGLQFGTAMEGQLKLMETLCVPTMFNDLVEFSHGMHRAMREKSQVVIIDDGTERELAEKSVQYLKGIHTPVFHI